ncbi:hypothetical protein [Burkholderia lata]|uniref:hypothetical protein n=1 Tax=Burkholderia lata (strain ATCC 17760 / DSM 23089 / LMG 22485 / NCIMB 9086 / R18194 / 383) TaxID=482957 RepID=UPI00145486EC|nr:hypothetical protein [Burkholderia lata]VWB56464.1 peptidase M24 [Burkholderia lata]
MAIGQYLYISDPNDINGKGVVLRGVREYRLARVQEQLLARNVPAILLYDPVNIRYATDTSNMQVWAGRNPARYVMVFATGRIVAWEFHSSEHVWDGLDLDVELRSAVSWTYFNAGPDAEQRAATWGAEIVDVFRKHAPGERFLAVDRLDPFGTAYLEKHGLALMDGQALMETARLIKSPGELVLIGESLRTAENRDGRRVSVGRAPGRLGQCGLRRPVRGRHDGLRRKLHR